MKSSFLSLITSSRLPYYLAFIALIPTCLLGIFFESKRRQWSALELEVEELVLETQSKLSRQAVNTVARSLFSHPNPAYVQQSLESLKLLEKERKGIEKLFQTPSYQGDPATLARYRWITSAQNALEFSYTSPQTAEGVQESTLSLVHPVELDEGELESLLECIETPREGAPLLLFKDFSLKRKENQLGGEVFQLSMTLIKREFE